MNRATPQMRAFARRLLVFETDGNAASAVTLPAAWRVCEKLRPQLATLMGNGGYQALLSRARTLANEEVAALRALYVGSDGSLGGWEELAAQVNAQGLVEGSVVLIAQLLGLLMVFIGEDLTVRLVREVWPKLSRMFLTLIQEMKTKKQNSAPRLKLPKKGPGPANKVTIRKIPTGVGGLDEILGGGFPEFSFNVIAGTPGCGKTTLAHQIVFANATARKPALYFTVLGEPAMKMLRYQQQYSFFDESRLGRAVRFINLAELVLENNLDAVLAEITRQVTLANPGIVVVDSFRTMARHAAATDGAGEMQSFVQCLAQFLTSWEATTFLVGEYLPEEMRDNPLFTIADGLLWLSQVTERNSVVRKLQVIKSRGHASVPGLHTMRIGNDGVQAFSRTLGLTGKKSKPRKQRRLSMGIPELDKMLGGGILEGDSLLVAGPSGTGKSALGTQFIAEGLRQGEAGVIAVFEERPEGYTERADGFGLNLKTPQEQGKLEILYLRPLDLSVDETMQEILDAVQKIGAKRLVIDSLAGLEMALAPGFRADFRESLYRMIGALTGAGITILSTVEVEDTFTALPFSHYAISFLTDDIIRLRYVEIDGQIRKIMVIVKMRGGNHSKDIREYVITDQGVVVIHPRRTDYNGLTTGIPVRAGPRLPQEDETPPEPKAAK